MQERTNACGFCAAVSAAAGRRNRRVEEGWRGEDTPAVGSGGWWVLDSALIGDTLACLDERNLQPAISPLRQHAVSSTELLPPPLLSCRLLD